MTYDDILNSLKEHKAVLAHIWHDGGGVQNYERHVIVLFDSLQTRTFPDEPQIVGVQGNILARWVIRGTLYQGQGERGPFTWYKGKVYSLLPRMSGKIEPVGPKDLLIHIAGGLTKAGVHFIKNMKG